MKIVIWKSKKDKQYYFHIQSRNRKLIASSEGYIRKSSAYKTAKKLIDKLGSAKIEFKK